MLSSTTNSFSQEIIIESPGDNSSELMKREDIEKKYTWDLTHIYKNEKDWEADYSRIEKQIEKIKSFEGKLGSSSKTLFEALDFTDRLWAGYAKLSQYPSLAKDLDLSNSTYQSMYEKANNLGNKLSTALAFFRPEILTISDVTIQKFLAENKDLKLYEHKLDNFLRMKAHTLSKEEEKILSLAGPVDDNFMATYRYWANTDIKFGIVKDEKGNDIQLSPARFYTGMYSFDRDYRERVFREYYKPFMQFKNTIASLYYGSIKSNIFQAKARKYNSTLEWSLDQPNVPVDVYKNLVNSVNQNLAPVNRWCSLKKKILGVEKMHSYDAYVTLFPGSSKKYTYDEAVQIVLKSLEPLGEDYQKNLRYAFENRWIDVYETKGKRSGAYSSGSSKESHPYVLLNWGYGLEDVFTLTHEMGHNMHSLYTAETQPYPYADYPIFLAEVASITNEMLLLDYLIENSTSKDEKLALIEKYINNIQSTFYRQTRFAEFEMLMQEYVEKGGALTPDYLATKFGELYQNHWGPDMFVDEEEKNSWSRIHHFFYDYYVYSYATSFAASQLIAENIKKEGQPAINKHLNFLKSGDSKYPIPTLKENGVDMMSPTPVVAVAKKMNELLDKMEALLNE
jgi:oligoendopeptidase F